MRITSYFWLSQNLDWSTEVIAHFAVLAPTLWNELPLHVKLTPTLPVFKSRLKAQFHSVAFTSVWELPYFYGPIAFIYWLCIIAFIYCLSTGLWVFIVLCLWCSYFDPIALWSSAVALKHTLTLTLSYTLLYQMSDMSEDSVTLCAWVYVFVYACVCVCLFMCVCLILRVLE